MKNLSKLMSRVMTVMQGALLIALAGLSVPATVRADDTEVFFPPAQTTLNPVNPNVMFVIDTSGSMGGTDGLSQTRLQRVQTAFAQIIGEMGSNVNVGLMRFNGLLGGPVMFPVAPIDAYVDDIDTTASGDRTVTQSIADLTSEAYQAASGGTVTVAPQIITLSKTNNSMGLRFDNVQVPQGVVITGAQVTFYGETGISTANMPVTIQAEQAANSAPYTTATNNITGRTYGGTATWTLPAATYNNGDDFSTPDLKTLLNSVIGAASWCGGNALSLKFATSTASTALNLAVVGSTDTAVDASGAQIGPILKPVLSLSFSPADPKLATGCNKAKVASQIKSSTDDSSETTESGNPNQPACKALFLNATPASTWPTSTSSGCGSLKKATKIAVRFPNLNIPQGATIASAVIDFTSYATDSNTPTLKIEAENAAAPPAYSATGANTVGNRYTTPGRVGGSVSWTTTGWSSATTTYSTPDLTALVQAVVNRADWNNTGNALSFFITPNGGGSNQHTAYSADGSLAYSPRLRIQIVGATGRLTVRQYLEQIVNSFKPGGYTPTMGTYYEAARYFRGEAAFYGRTRSFGDTYVAGGKTGGTGTQIDGSTDYATNSRISHRASFDYGKGTPLHNYPTKCSDLNLGSKVCDGENWTGTSIYESPITDGCQSNNIILLSDGLPNQTSLKSVTSPYDSPITLIPKLPGWSGTCATEKDSTGATQAGWLCSKELADFLFSKDQSPTYGGVQGVRTYTIAFGPDFNSGSPDAVGAEFLRNMATNGGGQFFTANTVSDVVNAFRSILGNILSIDTTFVAPAVTVNAFNRFATSKELYFAVFRPDTDAVWKGNLKRYQLLNGQIYDNSSTPIPAVDSATGFFKDGTQSFWSTLADGADIGKGGAASMLTNTRKVYTYVNAATPSNVDLTATANAFADANAAITIPMLGLPGTATAADRTAVIKWASGIDVLDENGDGVLTDARKSLGDPLHSEPILITYDGSLANPDVEIFMGTNMDGLHAFKSQTGAEDFSFLPKESLANLNAFYTDSGSYLNRPNGVDGPITAWTNDSGDKVISTGGTDFAYIYAGMRRGGNTYHALDVTNRAVPKLMFQITGGTGSFTELGQTWSRALHRQIRIGGADKDVLIFTGGYDPAEDGGSATAVTPDSIGRALYVVDAKTGARLWWASIDATANLVLPEMKYSIPASPTAIDLDGDGRVDRIYVADAGGQIFRIVLGKDGSGTPSLSNATGSRIAALSGTTVASAHRFYSTPDIALITANTSTPFLSVSIGSGFHEHPLLGGNAGLGANEDRFYVLRDPDISNTSVSSFFVNGDADLYDATANLAGSTTATVRTQALADIAAKKGFYIKLVNSTGGLTGEKVMTESTTFNNQVLFATFQPGVNATTCSAVQGLSRFYQISVTDGTPTQHLSGSAAGTPLTTADRSTSLKQGGLPPNPTILFPSDAPPTVVKGPAPTPTTAGTTTGSLTNPDGTTTTTTKVTNADGTYTKTTTTVDRTGATITKTTETLALNGDKTTTCNGATCVAGVGGEALVCIGAQCFKSGLGLVTTKTFWQKIER
jgi:type IV pilus assembly protein PilY1